MSYTITKEQIHQLLPTISSTGEDLLKKWFRCAFELPNGVWYWNKIAKCLFFKTGSNKSYGFQHGEWYEEGFCTFTAHPEGWQPATEEDVKDALVKEAEKRYAGNKFVSINPRNEKQPVDTNFHNWYFSFTENKLYTQKHLFGGKLAFQNGKWAEIIKPELPKSVTDWISQLGKDEAIRLINETQGE